jgi:hypothetical protein
LRKPIQRTTTSAYLVTSPQIARAGDPDLLEVATDETIACCDYRKAGR